METISKKLPFVVLAAILLASFLTTFSVLKQESVVNLGTVAPILLTVFVIALIYFCSLELLGIWWALVPSFIFGLSPTILATDHFGIVPIGAAMGILLSIYAYNNYLSLPSRNNLILAGVAIAIAELFRPYSILLLPFFLVLITIMLVTAFQNRDFWKNALKYYAATIVIFVIAFAIDYLFFALIGSHNPIQPPIATTPIYFLGHVVNSVGLFYFLTVFALKGPIPILIIFALTIFLSLWSIIKTLRRGTPTFPEYLGTNYQEFSMILFIVIYIVYGIAVPLNIGMQQLVPILGLICILMTMGLKNWVKEGSAMIKLSVIALLFIWFIVEMVLAYPYYLSYFNEFVGIGNGYKYAVGANYDWGQDLQRLSVFVKENNISSIAVDYYGTGNVSYYLGSAAVPWDSKDGDPRESNIHWLAISVTNLQLAIQPTASGMIRDPEDSYEWLTAIRPPEPGLGNLPPPDYVVGTSIFIYKLDGSPGT